MAEYMLIDHEGNRFSFDNLQDKQEWTKRGLRKEIYFVELYGGNLGLEMNPEKEINPFAPDLISNISGRLADLKTENTPFFSARRNFGLDPQYTVVFNEKDRERYKEQYPEIDIYFWVNWLAVGIEYSFEDGKKRVQTVQPMEGIWYIPFLELDKILENAPLHRYQQRTGDTLGNAQKSFVFSILDPRITRLL